MMHAALCELLGLPGKDSISSLKQLMTAWKLAPLFLLPDDDLAYHVLIWELWYTKADGFCGILFLWKCTTYPTEDHIGDA